MPERSWVFSNLLRTIQQKTGDLHSQFTLGDLTLSLFQALLIHPQGWQGCQNDQKSIRISTKVVWWSTIQPNLNYGCFLTKLANFWCKSGQFLTLFWSFFNFGWMVDHQTTLVEIMRLFWSFWHPYQPWECISSAHREFLLRFFSNPWYLCSNDFWKSLEFTRNGMKPGIFHRWLIHRCFKVNF